MNDLSEFQRFGDIEDLRKALIASFMIQKPLSPELLNATLDALHGKKPHKKSKTKAERDRYIAIAVSYLHYDEGKLLDEACQIVGHHACLSGETVEDIYQRHILKSPG